MRWDKYIPNFCVSGHPDGLSSLEEILVDRWGLNEMPAEVGSEREIKSEKKDFDKNLKKRHPY